MMILSALAMLACFVLLAPIIAAGIFFSIYIVCFGCFAVDSADYQ